jgi:hypothetical protein
VKNKSFFKKKLNRHCVFQLNKFISVRDAYASSGKTSNKCQNQAYVISTRDRGKFIAFSVKHTSDRPIN